MKNDPGTMIRELTSTIRTVVDDLLTDLAETENARQAAVSLERSTAADLVMCREQLAQETERAESYRLDVAALRDALDAPDDADVNQLIDVVHAITELAEKAEYAAQQLPTPDATNPAHLAFIDAGIEALVQDWADGSLPQAVGRVQQAIRAEGARLEAAQQQADAEKSLIEKAAKVIAFAAERNDLGVTESEMWETYLASESRCKYLDYARALHAASLLEGGAEQDDVEEESRRGISNGHLLAMDHERRTEVIASLSPEVRRELANIASLGASRLISQGLVDNDWRTASRLASARELVELTAGLLQGGES